MDNEKISSLKAYQSIPTDIATRLSTINITAPQIPSLTPRWLLRLLPWENVDTGIYRINQVQYLRETYKLNIPNNKLTPYILKNIAIFKHVPLDLLENVVEKMHTRTIQANEVIIRQGEEKSDFYIVIEGQFDVTIQGLHTEKLIIKTLSAGDYFGEIALIENLPRQASVTATTSGKILYIDKTTFDEIFKDPGSRKLLQEGVEERKVELELVNQYGEFQAPLVSVQSGESLLPRGFVSYRAEPKEIHLSSIQTIIDMNSRITDVYNVPYDQLEQQMRITIENIREREEWELINNKSFGLINNIHPEMITYAKKGAPTPDDLDDLLSLIWKKPSFFLAHPKAIAAFGRECTFRGVPPPTVDIFGVQFLTWRGIPLIPSDKLMIRNKNGLQITDILLMRVGKDNQGILGLHKADLGTHNVPSLTIQYMGTNDHSIARYLLTKYLSLAVLVPDALGVLKNVEIASYHQYD